MSESSDSAEDDGTEQPVQYVLSGSSSDEDGGGEVPGAGWGGRVAAAADGGQASRCGAAGRALRQLKEMVQPVLDFPPLSRAWVVVLLLSTLLCLVRPATKQTLALHWPSVTGHGELWRLISTFCAFGGDSISVSLDIAIIGRCWLPPPHIHSPNPAD